MQGLRFMARRKKDKVVKYPLLFIEWLDHHACGAWTEKVDHAPSVCYSIGWLVKEDRIAITLASSLSPPPGPDVYGNTQYLLKRCIVKRKVYG